MKWTNRGGNKKWLESDHNWKADEDNWVDMFAGVDEDIHNGPVCLDCGFTGCWHCESECPPCSKGGKK